jgi:ATP-dependent RNA helicase RhlE
MVEKLARKSMNKPQQVIIAKTADKAPKIEQSLYWLKEDEKLSRLVRILQREEGTFFVFVNTKEKTQQLARLLDKRGIHDVTYIHSDLQQEHRELAVADFKSGKSRIIIATDVMGRGIDVDDVAHVVNYDVPKEAADYIHRIGRTGRRGLTGHASTFAIPGKDDKAIEAIARIRGVDAPAKNKPEERRPPEKRPSPQRPDQKNSRPRGPRPQREQRQPREHREQREPREQRPHPSKAASQTPRPVPKKPDVQQKAEPGLIKKVLGIFGFKK